MNIENLCIFFKYIFMCVISIFEIFKVICISKNTQWMNFDCANLSLLNSCKSITN